jgi:parallel beta-helix repeat protein
LPIPNLFAHLQLILERNGTVFKIKQGLVSVSVGCVFIFLMLAAGVIGCGGGSSTATTPPQSVAVSVTSSGSTVLLGSTLQFTAKVSGTANTAVSWSVNGVSGGNSMIGTISSAGLYTAPQDLPNPATVTIQATSQADGAASASAVLGIDSDISVSVAANPSIMSSVFPGGTLQLRAAITSAGHPDTNVKWAVNGAVNGNLTVGTITVTGADTALYTAPDTAPNPDSVNINAVCEADSSKSGTLPVAIQPCTLNGAIGYVTPSPYVPPSGSTCDVSDLTTLTNCVAAVHNGTIANVRFTAMVNCSGSGACLVDLTNVKGPVAFFGAPGISAGFLRTDSYTYPILNVSGATDLTIANLTFDEGPDDPACTPSEVNGTYTYPCQSTISIDHSSNIALMQLSILRSKNHAIQFSSTQGLIIQDSQIQAAGVFGIWSGSDQSQISSNVSITNNLIQDVQSNGIYLSFTQNTTIKGNTLKHNHHVALFNMCNGLCPGGQIDMLDNTSLQIYSNEIIDGQIDLNNATGQTDGIEIADPNENVMITNNEIANNLGGGILADPATMGMNFQITGNKIYSNGVNLFGLSGTGIQELGDCFMQ